MRKLFTSAELAVVSKIKLGPDYITELTRTHFQEGLAAIPRGARGLILSFDKATSIYTIAFPFDVCPGEPRIHAEGHIREVHRSMVQTVAQTCKADWEQPPILRTRQPTY